MNRHVTDADRELLELAIEARKRAYVPYSRYGVGAALRTSDGRLFLGANIENASYGLTCCAERTAIFKAVSEGALEFESLAVVTDNESVASPCGACRQVMMEFAPSMRVILGNLNREASITTPSELLPHGFSRSYL